MWRGRGRGSGRQTSRTSGKMVIESVMVRQNVEIIRASDVAASEQSSMKQTKMKNLPASACARTDHTTGVGECVTSVRGCVTESNDGRGGGNVTYLKADEEVHNAGEQQREDHLHDQLRHGLGDVVGRDIVRSRRSLSEHDESFRRDCVGTRAVRERERARARAREG
jgi:hypothetical protein